MLKVNSQHFFVYFGHFWQNKQIFGGGVVFSDNYVFLCAKKKKAVTTAAEEMGFSRSAGKKWAAGTTPRDTALVRIADYFGCTVADLLADNEKPAAQGDGLTDTKRELIEIISQMTEAEATFLLAALKVKAVQGISQDGQR